MDPGASAFTSVASSREGRPRGKHALLLHLQLDRARDGVDVRVVVFVYARLEGARADRILRTKAILDGYCLTGADGIEVQDRLRGGLAELLQPAALLSGGLGLHVLQVFAEQVESGR